MFNGVYRRTCNVHKSLMVYIVELVLFNGFNGANRRTCTLFKGLNRVYRRTCTPVKGFNRVYRQTCTVQSV